MAYRTNEQIGLIFDAVRNDEKYCIVGKGGKWTDCPHCEAQLLWAGMKREMREWYNRHGDNECLDQLLTESDRAESPMS